MYAYKQSELYTILTHREYSNLRLANVAGTTFKKDGPYFTVSSKIKLNPEQPKIAFL